MCASFIIQSRIPYNIPNEVVQDCIDYVDHLQRVIHNIAVYRVAEKEREENEKATARRMRLLFGEGFGPYSLSYHTDAQDVWFGR